MNSPHNCLCHHVDFSIDTASLLFRVLTLNSTFPNKYSPSFKARSVLNMENAAEHAGPEVFIIQRLLQYIYPPLVCIAAVTQS